MLKSYLQAAGRGGSSEFWEDSWSQASLDTALRFCESDPLRRLFEEMIQPGTTFLEGGCGLGQYVRFYDERGAHVVGLDFTERPLVSHKRRFPESLLARGDVAQLPFADSTFDVYYSGGVVEHFEDGPTEALAEARRVLKADGYLLITVPYFNGVRRAIQTAARFGVHSSADRVVYQAVEEEPPPNHVFFQYAYGRDEFRKILEGAGFRVLRTRGTHFLWGLREIGFIDSLMDRAGKRQPPSASTADGVEVMESELSQPSRLRTLLKRGLLEEDDRYLPVLPLLRRLSANMMLYVCRPT